MQDIRRISADYVVAPFLSKVGMECQLGRIKPSDCEQVLSSNFKSTTVSEPFVIFFWAFPSVLTGEIWRNRAFDVDPMC